MIAAVFQMVSYFMWLACPTCCQTLVVAGFPYGHESHLSPMAFIFRSLRGVKIVVMSVK